MGMGWASSQRPQGKDHVSGRFMVNVFFLLLVTVHSVLLPWLPAVLSIAGLSLPATGFVMAAILISSMVSVKITLIFVTATRNGALRRFILFFLFTSSLVLYAIAVISLPSNRISNQCSLQTTTVVDVTTTTAYSSFYPESSTMITELSTSIPNNINGTTINTTSLASVLENATQTTTSTMSSNNVTSPVTTIHHGSSTYTTTEPNSITINHSISAINHASSTETTTELNSTVINHASSTETTTESNSTAINHASSTDTTTESNSTETVFTNNFTSFSTASTTLTKSPLLNISSMFTTSYSTVSPNPQTVNTESTKVYVSQSNNKNKNQRKNEKDYSSHRSGSSRYDLHMIDSRKDENDQMLRRKYGNNYPQSLSISQNDIIYSDYDNYYGKQVPNIPSRKKINLIQDQYSKNIIPRYNSDLSKLTRDQQEQYADDANAMNWHTNNANLAEENYYENRPTKYHNYIVDDRETEGIMRNKRETKVNANKIFVSSPISSTENDHTWLWVSIMLVSASILGGGIEASVTRLWHCYSHGYHLFHGRAQHDADDLLERTLTDTFELSACGEHYGWTRIMGGSHVIVSAMLLALGCQMGLPPGWSLTGQTGVFVVTSILAVAALLIFLPIPWGSIKPPKLSRPLSLYLDDEVFWEGLRRIATPVGAAAHGLVCALPAVYTVPILLDLDTKTSHGAGIPVLGVACLLVGEGLTMCCRRRISAILDCPAMIGVAHAAVALQMGFAWFVVAGPALWLVAASWLAIGASKALITITVRQNALMLATIRDQEREAWVSWCCAKAGEALGAVVWPAGAPNRDLRLLFLPVAVMAAGITGLVAVIAVLTRSRRSARRRVYHTLDLHSCGDEDSDEEEDWLVKGAKKEGLQL